MITVQAAGYVEEMLLISKQAGVFSRVGGAVHGAGSKAAERLKRLGAAHKAHQADWAKQYDRLQLEKAHKDSAQVRRLTKTRPGKAIMKALSPKELTPEQIASKRRVTEMLGKSHLSHPGAM